jgi:betaine-aldehyde dehydrogenase
VPEHCVNSLFIDGEWSAAVDGSTREIRSPHDGTIVARVSEAGVQDVSDAIAAARTSFDSKAFSSWSWAERSALVARVADLLERDLERLALLESGDTGKRIAEARYAGLGLSEHDRVVHMGDEQINSRIVSEPVGVAALIGPWNYPLLQASWKVAPALVAGCSFILKPSELTPSTAIALLELINEAGVPKGVANLILGASHNG